MWMYPGQIVYVDARLVKTDAKPGQGLRCKVAAAHGDTARVVNESWGFDQLMDKYDLWVTGKN